MTAPSPRGPRPSATLRGVLALALALPVTAASLTTAGATPVPQRPAPRDQGPVGHTLPKTGTMTGAGGAVASVDPVASQVGIDVLKRGGNAADAAVATAAALGVVEPYANGIGGGGYFVYYDARTKRVSTIDGRETAPAGMTETSFLEGGKPMDFTKAVNSGLSVGVPGTVATWQAALQDYGTRSFSQMLAPAEEIARRGFVVDDAFETATADNAKRFAQFPATASLFLPGGKPVEAGTVLRNPDLAATYAELRPDTAAEYPEHLGERPPVADDMLKLLVRHPQLDEAELLAVLEPVVPPDVLATYSGIDTVEITGEGVHKARALAVLCDRLGVDASEVVAIGDNRNDVEMLAWAGRGVALGDALDEVKQVADDVTGLFLEGGTVDELNRWFG